MLLQYQNCKNKKKLNRLYCFTHTVLARNSIGSTRYSSKSDNTTVVRLDYLHAETSRTGTIELYHHAENIMYDSSAVQSTCTGMQYSTYKKGRSTCTFPFRSVFYGKSARTIAGTVL